MEQFVIRQEGTDWVLYSHDGSRVLGRHKSEADAQAQERAIEAAKHMAELPFDAEIFATGEWGGRAWSDADLDAMVDNFTKLYPAVKPPVTLGHDAKATHDGNPAMGWVTALRRNGTKLIAQLSQVPTVVREAIRQGLYKTVSSGIYPAWQKTSWEQNLKSGASGPALAHVALLGSQAPEVKTLADLETYLTGEHSAGVLTFAAPTLLAAEHMGWTCPICDAGVSPDYATCPSCGTGQQRGEMYRAANLSIQTTTHATHKETGMTPDEKTALMAELSAEWDAKLLTATQPLTAEITKLSEANAAKDTEITRLSTESKTLRDKSAADASRALHVEAERFVESRIKRDNLRIFPTQAPQARALYERLDGDTPIVSADDAKAWGLKRAEAYSARDLFAEFVDQHPATPLLAERSHAAATTIGRSFEETLADVAKAHNLDVAKHSEKVQALAYLAKEHPDLVPDYRNPRAA